jgi:hypothetical protein
VPTYKSDKRSGLASQNLKLEKLVVVALYTFKSCANLFASGEGVAQVVKNFSSSVTMLM